MPAKINLTNSFLETPETVNVVSAWFTMFLWGLQIERFLTKTTFYVAFLLFIIFTLCFPCEKHVRFPYILWASVFPIEASAMAGTT